MARSVALHGQLHTGGLDCQFLPSVDPELQRVMAAWGGLPTAIRTAIATRLECQKKSEGEIAFAICAMSRQREQLLSACRFKRRAE